MKKLTVDFKNGTGINFDEESIDCTNLTIKGHIAKISKALKEDPTGFYAIDSYNIVLLDEVIAVYIS